MLYYFYLDKLVIGVCVYMTDNLIINRLVHRDDEDVMPPLLITCLYRSTMFLLHILVNNVISSPLHYKM